MKRFVRVIDGIVQSGAVFANSAPTGLIEAPNEVQEGWSYSAVTQSFSAPELPPSPPVLPLEDLVFTETDSTPINRDKPELNRYSFDHLGPFRFSAYIKDGNGNVATFINTVPGEKVKLTLQEQADDVPNGIEYYISLEINNGHLSAEFTFEKSGNFKVTADRINRSLTRRAEPDTPDFHLDFETIDLLV